MNSVTSVFMLIIVALFFALIIGFVIAKARASRYRNAGSMPDQRTLQEYGTPVKSLFTSTEFWSLRHHITVTDEADNPVYESISKFLSFVDSTEVSKADGSHVAHIQKKFLSIHQRHFVTMADGTFFELSNELWHLVKDIINIEGLGWRIEGNILQMNFVLSDQAGNVIAVIGQKMLSLHDKYSVDIYQPQYEEIVVAVLITLQHMIRDREAAASAASNSSGSSSSSSASG